MNSHVTQAFRDRYDHLPSEVQRRADAAFRRFQQDPSQRGLKFKLVNAKYRLWSARVSDDYRVLGQRDENAIRWFWIGTHSDYDKLLDPL